MTHEEYLERNSKGFEGDNFVSKEIEKLIASEGIDLVIELGSYLGYTSRRFASMAKAVITVEINNQYFETVLNNIVDLPNVSAINGSSTDTLPNLLEANRDKNIFIYVDSHWYDYCPLIEELAIIKRSGLKPTLAIHDWKVPNRPELGYDSYNGQDFTYDWIKPSLDDIYGENGYEYFYNNEAEGAMRGLIYIKKKAVSEVIYTELIGSVPLTGNITSDAQINIFDVIKEEEKKENENEVSVKLSVQGEEYDEEVKIGNELPEGFYTDNELKKMKINPDIRESIKYPINWDLVQNNLDVLRILKAINPCFTEEAAEIEGISQYLKK